MTVTTFLQQKKIPFEAHKHDVVYTAQQLAAEEGVSGYEVAKPVIVKGAKRFAMCVLAAPHHLDQRKAAEALGEKEVRLATEQEMADRFADCELGAEPPIGKMFHMKTVMDSKLRNDEYLVMQAGSHRESIRMRRADWEKVCKPVIASIAME